jgi:hypothetical protein
MVTPRTGKPAGRPSIAWCDDPDRYAVALIAALDALGMASTRQAALLAAVLMLDKHAGVIAGKGDSYERVTGPGETIATEEGRADALRKKQRHWGRDAEAARWLIAMAGIFMLLIGAKDDRARIEAMRRAASNRRARAFVRDLLLLLQPPVGTAAKTCNHPLTRIFTPVEDEDTC